MNQEIFNHGIPTTYLCLDWGVKGEVKRLNAPQFRAVLSLSRMAQLYSPQQQEDARLAAMKIPMALPVRPDEFLRSAADKI